MEDSQILLTDFLLKLEQKQSAKLYAHNLNCMLYGFFYAITERMTDKEVTELLSGLSNLIVHSEDQIPPEPNYLKGLGL